MGSSRGVVVTGVGVISAFGRGLGPLSDGLRAGRDALRQAGAESGGPALGISVVAGVPGDWVDDPDFVDDRKSTLALLAASDALDVAGRPAGAAGVWLGTGLSSVTPMELAQDAYPHLVDGRLHGASMTADIAAGRVAPSRHHAWRAARAVAARHGIRGPVETSFSACAAGAQAIAAAARAVRRGEVEWALAGGHDAMIHPLGMLSFVVLGALSETRCRPFDRRRDGFTIGEGAAVLVLESEGSARARGARILARVLGAGSSVDAWRVTAPHPEGRGAALAMRRALADAGLDAGAVDHVNAHGTGTPVGDAAEARAIAQVLGGRVPVSSIKGAIGHCIAAAGAVEAAVCVAGLDGGWTPGTAGLEEPGELPVFARAAPAEDSPGVVVSNSFGFGGQNCSLILGAAGFKTQGRVKIAPSEGGG